MTTWIAVSATAEEAATLAEAGPRRDFLALAERLGGTLLYRAAGGTRGRLARLVGPHVRQAWRTARSARTGDVVFADGEHIAIPLLFFLALFLQRPAIVTIGHMPGRWWKLRLLWLGTRLGTRGVLLLHSRLQDAYCRGWLSPSWRAELVPYQVDTEFWTDGPRHADEPSVPIIVAAGSEQRDYDTLIDAAAGLHAHVLIAAGSLWAREIASTGRRVPDNVEVHTDALPFRALLERYRDASVVVVPLLPGTANQAGVTTMLEAMSVERPVIVSATPGQSDVISGPLVRADGTRDDTATAHRGPGFGRRDASATPTGLYVPPGDPAALRAALMLLLEDVELRRRLGTAARASVLHDFTFEGFVSAIESAVRSMESPAVDRSRVAL